MALFLLLAAGFATYACADEVFGKEVLTIETASGVRHELNVELALTSSQRQQGLMFRQALEQDAGMLFDFGEEREVTMWMRNTPLPLDMLFIESDGKIRRIEHNTVPYSETVIGSRGPVKFVLEINGGRAAALGIQAGDTARSAQIGNVD